MKKLLLPLFFCISSISLLMAQGNCISVDPDACRNECLPVTYTGPHPPTANYSWTSTCGVFEHPNQQDPGNHCFVIQGVCTLQVIVTESGMSPDTCVATVNVHPLPDGLIQGDTIICSGTCASLITQFFAGTPPFTYQLDDGNFVNFFTSFNLADTIPVCPAVTTTYTLVSITDANQCNAQGPFNEVTITVTAGISASITQNGNTLCANPPGQNYQWYDCGFNTLESISPCLDITADGCHCVIVSDQQTGLCVDTVCGNFTSICDITCSIVATDSICTGDSVLISYAGNAPDNATFTWTIDLPGVPDSLFTGTDSIWLAYNLPGCYAMALTVSDGTCSSECADSVCVYDAFSTVTFGDNLATCDSCLSIPITFTGTGPWAVHILHNGIIDTITGINSAVYNFTQCLPEEIPVTYVLLWAADEVGLCPPMILDDSVVVIRHGAPEALILQNGNEICAAQADGTYEWYDCGYMQLLTFDQCFSLADTGCFCLTVFTSFCADTACGEYLYTPCELTCGIQVEDACTGDSVVFVYTGNATSTAIFNWAIDVPGFPQMPVTGNDTVILVYDQAGCYQVSLTVYDAGCTVTCTDSVCITGPGSTASICCDEVKCAACTDLTLTFSGTAPWTAFISDGNTVDTLTGIQTSPFLYTVCPPADSMTVYTLLGATDSINTCPAAISSPNTASITLHPYPEASILQTGDTLCAFPAGMPGYGWYVCPQGPYISNSQCFVPSSSGCYCVDVSTADDCTDSACVNIILSSVKNSTSGSFAIFPNPSEGILFLRYNGRALSHTPWKLYTLQGEMMAEGILRDEEGQIQIGNGLPAGMYFLRLSALPQEMQLQKIALVR